MCSLAPGFPVFQGGAGAHVGGLGQPPSTVMSGLSIYYKNESSQSLTYIHLHN